MWIFIRWLAERRKEYPEGGIYQKRTYVEIMFLIYFVWLKYVFAWLIHNILILFAYWFQICSFSWVFRWHFLEYFETLEEVFPKISMWGYDKFRTRSTCCVTFGKVLQQVGCLLHQRYHIIGKLVTCLFLMRLIDCGGSSSRITLPWHCWCSSVFPGCNT